jgi:hypothetical protein
MQLPAPSLHSDLAKPALALSKACTAMSQTDIKTRVTDPEVVQEQGLPAQQLWASPVQLPEASGGCNSYLPGGSTLERYLWSVQQFVAAGEGAGCWLTLPWLAFTM